MSSSMRRSPGPPGLDCSTFERIGMCSVTLTCGACEVRWWWVWLAGSPVAVPGSAGDLFGEVAPLMLVVVQVVALTQQVAGTTVVALVVPNKMSLSIQI